VATSEIQGPKLNVSTGAYIRSSRVAASRKNVRVSLRVQTRFWLSLRSVAVKQSWGISDFARALIVLGMTARFQALSKEENLDRLRKISFFDMMDAATRGVLGGRKSRGYPVRTSASQGEVLSIVLPKHLLGLAESYAGLVGAAPGAQASSIPALSLSPLTNM